MPSETKMTIAAIVGRNVRRTRELRGWDLDRLADELALFDVVLEPTTVAEIEEGWREISVSELLVLGVVLGVAPHLLLYPKSNSPVVVGPGQDGQVGDVKSLEEALLDAETHLPSHEFASWLWQPDGHRYTVADVSEETLWAASSDADGD